MPTCDIAIIIVCAGRHGTTERRAGAPGMNTKYEGKGYQPVYTRTELTDALHNAFGFCTSKEIIPISKMRNICSQTKK